MPEPRQKTKAPRIENIKKSKKVLGEQICSCILFVHAFLGCDTISPVHGSGKPAPLKKILTSDHYSLALAQTMSRGPGTPKEEIIAADEQAPVCLCNEKHGEVLMLYATHASRKRWQGVQYKNKVWRAGLFWIFRAQIVWWSHLQARRRSLRAC